MGMGSWSVMVLLSWVAAVAPVAAVPSSAPAESLSVVAMENGRSLRLGERTLLELGSPSVAGANFRRLLYSFPGGDSAAGAPRTKADNATHGRWTETITPAADSITIRYEFDLPAESEASRVQWAWRLEPQDWAGVFVQGVAGGGETPVGPHPIEGLNVADVRRLEFVLADLDLSVTCRAADGAWSFRDARSSQRIRSYRLEYDREAVVEGRRSGWIEVTIRAKPVASPVVALTAGAPVPSQPIAFEAGPLRDSIHRKLVALAFLHTVQATVPRGQAGGRVNVVYADGQTQTISLRGDEAFSSPTDDPRSVGNGRLMNLADKTVAWVSVWRNPRPTVAIQRLEAQSLAGGWRLIGASGIDAAAHPGRVTSILRGDGTPLAEESVVSLDGTWRFSADAVEERDIPVPAFWERQPGLEALRQGTYRRLFDVPGSFAGRRVALRFDAVGDAAEVWVNGRKAGGQISPGLPFEVDISSLVAIPSADNRLEVRVQDDTHFGIERPVEPWRSARHWIPRGMGTNNRKGLYQSVTLRARPVVRISDVRVQTSVRKSELTVIYTLQNTSQQTVNAQIVASVHPEHSEAAVMSLPPAEVQLPGYVTTQVVVKAPFQGVELWQPNHPTLYSLRSLLMDGDKRLERADTRFGFREVWFEGRNFYLNGIRCNLRGESPAYPEKTEFMATREAAAEMIRRYQKANCNVLRFHAMPAPPHVLDLCDEMGMLVIDESGIYASWGMLMPEHADWMANCRDHLVRWVRRDRNHPSVLLWSAENEGLNVNALTPAQLAEYRRVIDAEDGTRPVIFDGDGTGMGASPASVKHYVRTVADLKDHGGEASGYLRDLRNDIYWATEYAHEIPLGIGEFLFPHGGSLRNREREACYMMGLQTRGYRLADWFDIRPYNPSYTGFLSPEGVRPGYETAYDIIVKSFAAVAVFDKAYDALGPYPQPPVLPLGQPATRELIVYNDTFEGEQVEIEWIVTQQGRRIAGDRLTRDIPLGSHLQIPIQFTPGSQGELQLELISRKNGQESFRDLRPFVVR